MNIVILVLQIFLLSYYLFSDCYEIYLECRMCNNLMYVCVYM